MTNNCKFSWSTAAPADITVTTPAAPATAFYSNCSANTVSSTGLFTLTQL